MQRKVKKSIEDVQHQRASNVFYGIRQSKSQYERQRLALNFESKEDAICRTEKRNILNLNQEKKYQI